MLLKSSLLPLHSFKVTVQFETEGNGQNEIVGHIWINQK